MKDNKNKYYKFGLYLLMLLLINLAAGSLFFRIDLTSNGLYSLSDASKEAVRSLREPLTINVFFSKNLPSPYNNIERYLHDVIAEYELHSNKKLNYRFYDVNAKEGDISEKAEENRKIANSYGIYPVNVQKIEQDEAKIQKAYMGLVFIHGDLVEKLPALISTEDLEYKITTTIQKMNNKISALLNLDGNIRINLLSASSLSIIAPLIKLEGLDSIESRLRSITKTLNRKAYGKLELRPFDPTEGNLPEDMTARFKRLGIEWVEIQTPDGRKIDAGKGVIAIEVEYGGRSVQKNLLSKKLNLTDRGLVEQYFIIEDSEIESFINENIDNVININEDIGYLTSGDTLSLEGAVPPQMQMFGQQQGSEISNFKTLVNREYNLKAIDLKKENSIPENIDTLIIAGPTGTFSDWELFQIDQFLMKGGSLALLIDSFREIQQQNNQQMYGMNQPVYMPLNTGLEKLLEHYGISVRKSYILDESCYINRDQNNNEMPIYFAPVIKNENIDHKLLFMKNINQLVMIKVSPLDSNAKENINYRKLVSSSEDSWEMKGRISLVPMMIQPPDDSSQKMKLDVAYLAEGEFGSYFEGKEIPEQPLEDKNDDGDKEDTGKKKEIAKPEAEIVKVREFIKKGKAAKIFVIASSETIKDNLIDENGLSPNAVFILNTLDHLNGRDKIAELRGKKQKFNPVDDTKAVTRTVIKVINIAGLPILFIVFGILVWIGRNKRRKRIFSIFNS